MAVRNQEPDTRLVEITRNDRPDLEYIRAGDLKVDHDGYQRKAKVLVGKIARNFNSRIFGVITVSRRANGQCYIIDGQHRVAAVVRMGNGATPVPCIVHEGLSYQDEALMFHLMNTQTQAMTPQDKMRGALESGDPIALDIREIVERVGFQLGLDDSALTGGRIPGIGALTKAHQQYKDGHLYESLRLIADTWGTSHGPRGTMIEGVSIFISFYREVWDRKRFITRLSICDPEMIVKKASETHRLLGVSTGEGVLYGLVDAYNNRTAKPNRIPRVEEIRAINKLKGAGDDK